jgi:hypothetical protein
VKALLPICYILSIFTFLFPHNFVSFFIEDVRLETVERELTASGSWQRYIEKFATPRFKFDLKLGKASNIIFTNYSSISFLSFAQPSVIHPFIHIRTYPYIYTSILLSMHPIIHLSNHPSEHYTVPYPISEATEDDCLVGCCAVNLVDISRHFRCAYCLHYQGDETHKQLSTSETSVSIYLTTQCNIPVIFRLAAVRT